MIDKKFKNHFILDVEADGPHVLDYNMISFGLVNMVDHSLSFKGEVSPIHNNGGGNLIARNVSGVSWEDQYKFRLPHDVMPEAEEFILRNIVGNGRATIWSDNPAFDWQFFNAYIHRYAGDNCAGWSSRRIGDFYAGLQRKPFNHSGWKRYRKTKHTHCPVDDARGNAEAMIKILDKI